MCADGGEIIAFKFSVAFHLVNKQNLMKWNPERRTKLLLSFGNCNQITCVYCVYIFVFLLAFIHFKCIKNWFYVAGFCIAWLGLVMLNGFLCMCFEHKVNTGNDLWVYCCTFGIVVVRSISNEQTIKFIKNSFMLKNDIHILNAMYFITFSYFSFWVWLRGEFSTRILFTSKLK